VHADDEADRRAPATALADANRVAAPLFPGRMRERDALEICAVPLLT